MGQKNTSSDNNIEYLIKKFKHQTLQKIVNKKYNDLLLNIQIDNTYRNLINIIQKQLPDKDGEINIKFGINNQSNTFLNITKFVMKSIKDIKIIALHIMILFCIFVECDNVIAKFNFKVNMCARESNTDNIAWLEPSLNKPFESELFDWFRETIHKKIIHHDNNHDYNHPFFLKIENPPEYIVSSLENDGIKLNSIYLNDICIFDKVLNS